MNKYFASTADIIDSLVPDEFLSIYAEDGGWIRLEFSGGNLFARRLHDEFVVVRTDGYAQVYLEDDDGWWYPLGERGYHFKIERADGEIAVYERGCDDEDFGFAVVTRIDG